MRVGNKSGGYSVPTSNLCLNILLSSKWLTSSPKLLLAFLSETTSVWFITVHVGEYPSEVHFNTNER